MAEQHRLDGGGKGQTEVRPVQMLPDSLLHSITDDCNPHMFKLHLNVICSPLFNKNEITVTTASS